MANVDDAGLTGFRPLSVRAYKLANKDIVGWTIARFVKAYPQYKIVNVRRTAATAPRARGGAMMQPALAGVGANGSAIAFTGEGAHAQSEALQAITEESLGAPDDLVLQAGDIVVLGGRLDAMTQNIGVIGPEVADEKALSIPLDQAEILVTNKEVEGKELREFRDAGFAGQIGLQRIERGGVPIPIGLNTKLQRFDVLFVAGLKSGVDKVAAMVGRVARPSTATDLLTLAVGMILGFAIGAISFPIAGSNVGLGNAGGLLVSGVIVSSAVSRLRFFGNTPNAARNILEDLGLIVFIAIVGVNSGAGLISQLSGSVALYIFVAGFICTTIPPILVWAIGYHWMKINPAVLMGGVAGARSHSGPAREAAKEIGSSVPWIGFPVGYAVSGVLLTVFGYVAMVMTK